MKQGVLPFQYDEEDISVSLHQLDPRTKWGEIDTYFSLR